MTLTVSHFFRNPFVFELFKKKILPGLISANGKVGLRVWCAGCARGEEAYSIAILLKEILSKEALPVSSFIIATDMTRITGFDGYIDKPIDIRKLPETVKNSLTDEETP